MLRTVFMGTPGFAVASLAAMRAAGHAVLAVYTQPPRPAGRGHRLQPSPVQVAAEAAGIPVRTPVSLRDRDVQAAFAALGAEVAVVAAYGLILPRAVLDAPRLGCINVHASLLPRWRGAAPIQRAILAGDTVTGVSIMRMEAGLDTGPVLLAEAMAIAPTDTATTLHDRLAPAGARLLVEALAGLEAGRLEAAPQPEEGVTYAHKIARAEGALDWRLPANALDRAVRALNPTPGTWFVQGGERIRVLAAAIAAAPAGAPPGTVLDDRLTVATGAGTLRPTRLQRPGRAAQDAGDLLRGFPIPPGTVLTLPDRSDLAQEFR